MDFSEKLKVLRNNKKLTQEELAEHLYVSRTAISKWESGKGYPSIDSLKDIATFFSVTVDELLSTEKIISIAKKEGKKSVQKICNLLFGFLDLFVVLLIVLPLYPKTINDNIYSINLINFFERSSFIIVICLCVFICLIILGILKIILIQFDIFKCQKIIIYCSLILNVFSVVFLIFTKLIYASVLMFMILIIKGVICLKYSKLSG